MGRAQRLKERGEHYGPLFGKDLISITDLTPNDIKSVLRQSAKMRKRFKHGPESKGKRYLKRRIVANVFLERSTRTRLSFASAAERLGGGVITITTEDQTSMTKGETLADTIRMLDSYASIIVLRQGENGGARLAADISRVPVINAGDGTGEHPTQALLDLFTIKRLKGRVSDLNIAIVGDLLNGRTAHSLAYALGMFGNHITFIAPDRLQVPNAVIETISPGNTVSTAPDLTAAFGADIVYMTRVQRERFTDPNEYENFRSVYTIDMAFLKATGKDVRIMHPLPRVDEVATEVDNTLNAAYFAQAKNGTPVRMALLAMILRGIG